MTNLRIVFLGPPGGGLNLLWSLAVEEQFYLVWPLLVFALSKRALLSVSIGIVALSPLARLATADAFGRTYPEVFFAPWCRFDVIAVGAAIAILMSDPRARPLIRRWSRRLVVPALLGLVGIALLPLGDAGVADPRRAMPFVAVGYSFIAVAFGVVLVAVLEPGWIARRVLASPVFVWIGRRSFGIYVWHTLVGTAIVGSVLELGMTGVTLPVAVALWLPLALAVAEVSWRFYERPLLSLKERFTLG
jgi:peptidoglycan/LPS O-acetylase OafA/YrhL